MIRRLTGPLLVAVVLAVASPVAATTLVAYDFTAIVSHASGAPADLEEGAIFSGRMIYDTDAASGGPVAGSGGSFSEAYTLSLPALPVMSLTFASGDTASSSSNGSADLVNFPDGSLFQDQVVIQSGGVLATLEHGTDYGPARPRLGNRRRLPDRAQHRLLEPERIRADLRGRDQHGARGGPRARHRGAVGRRDREPGGCAPSANRLRAPRPPHAAPSRSLEHARTPPEAASSFAWNGESSPPSYPFPHVTDDGHVAACRAIAVRGGDTVRVLATSLSMLTVGCLVATHASASSILGDTFSLDFSCAGCANNGPMDHVAQLPGAGFTLFDGTTYSAQQDEVSVQWVDEDTFAFVVDFNSSAEDNIELVLSGLDFVDGAIPQVIDGVSPNAALTDCPDEFVGCADVVGPFTSFTDSSITVRYSQSSGLRADGPVWAFDVSTVPEPSTFALLAGGLLALAARRREPQRP